ncbi:MAG: hypothetical protein IPN51_11690 [Chloracidobacterium sp.]|nr:hypothetical protein [Chloracidobacterium sp.]
MNKITVSISILLLVLTTAFTAFAQDDETREGTGLPTLIGENAERGNRMNISGRVTLQGTDQPKRRPLIAVSVLLSGAVLERATTNDKGFLISATSLGKLLRSSSRLTGMRRRDKWWRRHLWETRVSRYPSRGHRLRLRQNRA